MIRLTGCLCVFMGCGYAWYLQRLQRQRQMRTRTELLSALRRMEQEIQSRQTPIPRLAEQLALGGKGEVRACFQQFLLLLRQDVPLAEAWKRGVEGLSLRDAERTAVSELGSHFYREESIVVKELNLTIEMLEECRRETQKQSAEIEKRATAMWFSAASLLVILLL